MPGLPAAGRARVASLRAPNAIAIQSRLAAGVVPGLLVGAEARS